MRHLVWTKAGVFTAMLVLGASSAWATGWLVQQPAQSSNIAAARSHYRLLGTDALAKERTRSKATLCVNTEKDGGTKVEQCLAEQDKTTEQNYLTYIRAIGALLRLPPSVKSAHAPLKRIPFDSAEDTWQTYRKWSCRSASTQRQSIGQAPVEYDHCYLQLTWNHMNELAKLYSSLWETSTTTAIQNEKPLPKLFASVLAKVKAKAEIAVLLPSKLPPSISTARYASADTVTKSSYSISVYYQLGMGDAGFAALFAADAHPGYGPQDIPVDSKVKLSHGVTGYFRSVSCGGSCAPANLWWEENGVLYQIQLSFSSDYPDSKQQKQIVAAANSAILAGPR